MTNDQPGAVPTNDEQAKVAEAFQKVFNSHGHAFHQAVLRVVADMQAGHWIKWEFAVSEFPVEGGNSTRIDFILKRPSNLTDHTLYLVAECKRADPALATWCFARARYVVPERGPAVYEPLLVEGVGVGTVSGRRVYMLDDRRTYHLPIDVKVKDAPKGSGTGSRGAIEDAATQVLRGVNGLTMLLARSPALLGPNGTAALMPVIFTTASLWTTMVDISNADVHTGELVLDRADVEPRSWIALQFPQGPGLRHPIPNYGPAPTTLAQALETLYLRTVFIVTPAGIQEFLQWSSSLQLFPD